MGTTAKALSLLDLFTPARPSAGLSDVARLSGLNKATCYRLLTELAAMGLVEQAGPAREYRIGPAVLRLAALREAAVPTREAALPVLTRMAEATGETAHLSHLVAGRLTTRAFVYSRAHATKVMMEDADILPFHATASGLSVLAFLPDALRDSILRHPLAQYAQRTPTDPAEVLAQLDGVRRAGLAEVASAFEADVHGIAAPLFGPVGDVIGATAIATPASRMTPVLHARISREVARGAAEITAAWGGRAPDEVAGRWAAAA